jgi:rRNA biogenesis protein RRP36
MCSRCLFSFYFALTSLFDSRFGGGVFCSPPHLSASEREMQLRARYKELEKSGGVEKYIRKKRKKKASKDRRIIPERRTRETS